MEMRRERRCWHLPKVLQLFNAATVLDRMSAGNSSEMGGKWDAYDAVGVSQGIEGI
jgi:hypothetical protein